MDKFVLIAAILVLNMQTAYADKIFLNTKTNPNTCKLSHKCDLVGVHDIEITNDSDQQHYYGYSYILCGDNDQCAIRSGSIYVKPHTTWNNHHDSRTTTVFEWQGRHVITAKTSITGTITEERIDQAPVEVN